MNSLKQKSNAGADEGYSSVFTFLLVLILGLLTIAFLFDLLPFLASSCSCSTTGSYYDFWSLSPQCRPCA